MELTFGSAGLSFANGLPVSPRKVFPWKSANPKRTSKEASCALTNTLSATMRREQRRCHAWPERL